MRIDRVIQTHERTMDYQQKESVYQELLAEYSQKDAMAEEFPIVMDVKWGLHYVPEKMGNSEMKQKMENSEMIRKKTAQIAAEILCTNPHSLKKYENLSLLLDCSCTSGADKKNEQIAELLTEGTPKIRSRTFQELLKPLMLAEDSVLEGKTDEELAQTWEKLGPMLYQCSVLDKIMTEAEQLKIPMEEKAKAEIASFFEKGQLSCQMTMGRASVIANACYAVLNDRDLRKLDREILKKEAKQSGMGLKDYLTDIAELSEHYEKHLRGQLSQKLSQLGYDKPESVMLGNFRGKPYEYPLAIEVLKTGRPVYVIGENRKLLHTVEVLGPDGFLKPVIERKKTVSLEKYLEDAQNSMRKLIKGQKELSESGRKEAQMYMAKAVCFQRLLMEKQAGDSKPGRLGQVIGNDERKFEMAAGFICKDERFQNLTKDITVEAVREFMDTGGERELLRRYVQQQLLGSEPDVRKSPKQKTGPELEPAVLAMGR